MKKGIDPLFQLPPRPKPPPIFCLSKPVQNPPLKAHNPNLQLLLLIQKMQLKIVFCLIEPPIQVISIKHHMKPMSSKEGSLGNKVLNEGFEEGVLDKVCILRS